MDSLFSTVKMTEAQVTLYVADPLRPRLVLQPWEAPTAVDTQLDFLILLFACSRMFNDFHLQLEGSLHLSAINENRFLRTMRGSHPQPSVVTLIRSYNKLYNIPSWFQDAFHSCEWECKWASSENTLPVAANILSLRIWKTALIQQISEIGSLQLQQRGSFVAWLAAVRSDDGAPCEGFVSRCLVQCFITVSLVFSTLCKVIFRFLQIQSCEDCLWEVFNMVYFFHLFHVFPLFPSPSSHSRPAFYSICGTNSKIHFIHIWSWPCVVRHHQTLFTRRLVGRKLQNANFLP